MDNTCSDSLKVARVLLVENNSAASRHTEHLANLPDTIPNLKQRGAAAVGITPFQRINIGNALQVSGISQVGIDVLFGVPLPGAKFVFDRPANQVFVFRHHCHQNVLIEHALADQVSSII